MDEKILVIIGIIVITLSCFTIIAFAPTAAAITAAITEIFKYSVLSLGSLATGVAIGTSVQKKKQEKIEDKEV